MDLRRFIASFLAVWFWASDCLVLAQVPPKSAQSGTVQKELKKETPPRKVQTEAPVIDIQLPAQKMQFPAGKKLSARKFVFQGVTVLSAKELEAACASFLNKELPLDTYPPLAAVEKAYKKKGFFLARAYLPVQEIHDGCVTIAVVEGRLGRVRVEKGRFYREDFIRRHFVCDVGGIVNYDRMVRSLLVLNEYTDLEVKALLEKGQEPFTVDVVLAARDSLPLHFETDYNNFGSKYVSRDRFGAQAEYANGLVPGDSLRVRETIGNPLRSLQYVNAAYSLPVNRYGTKAGFSFTNCEFDVQREFRVFDTNGSSRVYSLSLVHPALRTLNSGIDLLAGFDYGNYVNSMSGAKTGNDRLRVLRAGASGNWMDGFRGRNFLSFTASNGFPDIFGGSRSTDPASSRSNAGGKFLKTNIDAARFQRFFWDSFILAKGSAQLTSDSLPVPEQFAIGGADSVRGYPVSEYLGDYGYTATLELRFPPPFIATLTDPVTHRRLKDSLQLTGFLDAGEAFIHKPLPGEHKDRFIMGAGAGVRYNVRDDFTVRLDFGFPVGGRKPSDDSDMTVYLQATARF